MVDEVEHRFHSVFDRGGEWVLRRTSVVDAAHDSMSIRNDCSCPPSVVLRPTKCKASAVEVDDDGITAFIRIGLGIVDVSVSLEMALVVPWYVERESDISLIWGDRSSKMPVCEVEGGPNDGGSSQFPSKNAILWLEDRGSSGVVS